MFNSISKCFRFNFHSKDTSKSSYSFQLWQRYITNTTKLQGKLDVRKLKLMTRGDKKSYTSILKHPAKKELTSHKREKPSRQKFLRNHKTCLGLDLKKKQTNHEYDVLPCNAEPEDRSRVPRNRYPKLKLISETKTIFIFMEKPCHLLLIHLISGRDLF